MSDADRPEGQRFSLLYIERGAPEQDSPRMRRRLAAVVSNIRAPGLVDLIAQRLGIDVPMGYNYIDWNRFFADAALRDVLDTITLVYEARQQEERSQRGFGNEAARFIDTVNAIFREENLQYAVDFHGGVHLTVDQEFERNRASVIQGLGDPRYVNVERNFQDAHERLNAARPDGRGAIRATFDAAEGLFRLMFPNEPRLNADRARANLRPVLQRMTDGNPPAAAASSKAFDALCEWVDACHNYRHEHGQPEVLEPPRWLAVLLVSTGASQIRWLAEIDAWVEAHRI